MEPKITQILGNSSNKSRCIVTLFKTYVSHRPESHGKAGHTAFYLTPIKNPKGPIWYKAAPLGTHTIEKSVKRLMSSISAEGYISNTSVRRTAKNRMMAAGIPREVIEKKTGRISERADMAYVEEHRFEKEMNFALSGTNEPDSKIMTMSINSATSSKLIQRTHETEPQAKKLRLTTSWGHLEVDL